MISLCYLFFYYLTCLFVVLWTISVIDVITSLFYNTWNGECFVNMTMKKLGTRVAEYGWHIIIERAFFLETNFMCYLHFYYRVLIFFPCIFLRHISGSFMGRKEDTNTILWIKWSTLVWLEKEYSGLGIKDIDK